MNETNTIKHRSLWTWRLLKALIYLPNCSMASSFSTSLFSVLPLYASMLITVHFLLAWEGQNVKMYFEVGGPCGTKIIGPHLIHTSHNNFNVEELRVGIECLLFGSKPYDRTTQKFINFNHHLLLPCGNFI